MTNGMKTSEFWVSNVFPGLMMILNSVFSLGIDWPALVGMFGLTASYNVNRAMIKTKGGE